MAPSCHDECIKGTIHAGLPQGKEESIHGLNTYVIGNRTGSRGIIVIYSDVFGLKLPNNKLIADSYAKSGEWLVYLPDFFVSDPLTIKLADVLIPADASKQSKLGFFTGFLANTPSYLLWSQRHKEGPTDKTCLDFLRALRRDTPAGQKIGFVGFCWGGNNKVDGKDTPLVDAVVALHPGNLSIPADVEGLVVPTSVGWGVEDFVVPLKQKAEVEDVYAKAKAAGIKVPEIEHKVYKPGRHGFAVRGNPDDPQEKACLEDSAKQVLEWFGHWL